MSKALISGISGQDGSYLAELLLKKGYEVHGIMRHVAGARDRSWRLSGIDGLHLHQGSVEDLSCIVGIVDTVQPNEVYHLAAQSFVGFSWGDQFSTLDTNIRGTANVLWAVLHRAPTARLYFAGSSEQFGKVRESPQHESTSFHPRSPYGVSKVAGFDLTRNFRESYGLFACSGILFNHESSRRGAEFVTRKIARGAARIALELDHQLLLGNLDARRDWGHAKDYVEAMWLMLQQEHPDDYVVATGESHSVREFCQVAFELMGLDYSQWVKTDPAFMRPAEVDALCGDASKARAKLGWRPSTSFAELVREMVTAEVERAKTHSS